MKKILHIIEAIAAKISISIFGAMPFGMASDIGGFLGKKIGPHAKAHTTARNNIKMVMPELPDERVEEILMGMWDNLGRNITEFAHVGKMSEKIINELVTIDGQEYLDTITKSNGCFIMTGHFSNWEMIATTAFRKGVPLHIVYRKANNPYVDKIICDVRKNYQVSASAKGPVGARQIIKAIKEGKDVAMLVDQKQNDGISVPFFGIPAMTAPAIAVLSFKYDYPIYPVKIQRVGNKFRIVFYPQIQFTKTGNDDEDILNLMTHINSIYEGWVKEHPEQWFWVHNRWPRK